MVQVKPLFKLLLFPTSVLAFVVQGSAKVGLTSDYALKEEMGPLADPAIGLN